MIKLLLAFALAVVGAGFGIALALAGKSEAWGEITWTDKAVA